MIRRGKQFAALGMVGVLALGACSSDSKKVSTTSGTGAATTVASSTAGSTGGSTASSTASSNTTGSSTVDTSTGSSTATSDTSTASSGAAAAAWKAPVDKCADPAAVTAPITGEIKIGSAVPISGSVAVAFAPVKAGFEAYVKYANDNKLLGDVKVTSDIRDDQYDATQTPGVVNSLIDDGVNMFSGIIGTPNNLAVRDALNEQCYPQLLNLTGDPAWGDSKHYPWTTGALVPYDIEAKIYAAKLKDLIGAGGTVALFSVNNDFGKVYTDAFKAAAKDAGLSIVDEETIEPEETAPPTNQLGAIAAKKPAAIMAIPLGAQCPTFTKELKNTEAANGGWKPVVFQTNTCASRLLIADTHNGILGLAGGSGDGIYTSSNLIDPVDPKNADNAGVKLLQTAYAASGSKDDLATFAVGWTVGESTLNILIAAQKTGTLSRETIMEAARSLTFTPSLARPGVQYKMNGDADPYTFQSLQVLQWNEANNAYTELGDLNTSFES